MTLENQIIELDINAFIGVYMPVERDSALADYVHDDEERMVSIEDVIDTATGKDLLLAKLYEAKGVSDVVISRGW